MKRILIFQFIIIALLVACEKGSVEDIEVVKYGKLEGFVYNEFGQALENALVETETDSTRTNISGKFSLAKIKIGEHTVSASKKNYLTKVVKTTITENEVSNLDFSLLKGEAFLLISDSTKNLNSQSGSFSIEVSSNAEWTVMKNSNWLNCEIQNGQGNSTVSFSFLQNQDDVSRTDSVIFSSGPLKEILIIHQAEPVKLIKIEGLIGNGEKDVKDSVYLLFNQAIQINSIKSNWELCVSEIEYSLMDNNQGVMFSYPCAELGGNYPFTISVSDTEGNVFTQNINVPFYKSKLDFDGFMTDFLLINNDKEILISTFYPSRLIKYSIESDAIVQTYDLSEYISPMKLSYNPYNSKIYIMGSNPDTDWRMAYANRPDVYSVDLETGQINKAFTVEPDSFDHPQYPANIPYNVGFTKSGDGIVLLRSNGSSGLRWKLIDCTNNDSIYTYPFYDSNIDEYTDFDNVHMNYDHTKLYLTQPYGSCHYGIFDESTNHISILTPSSITRGVTITANREIDKFYAHQLYDQFIIDLDGNMSEITYLDGYFGGSDDFSYRENDSNIIYLNVAISAVGHPNGLYILDYNIGSIIMSCDIIDYLLKFTSTIDGKYAITYKQNSDISSSVYIFETKYFHRTLK